MIEFLKKFFDIKFWKFIGVGVINTLVGNGVMFLLYNVVHASYWLSSAANYIVGSIVSTMHILISAPLAISVQSEPIISMLL